MSLYQIRFNKSRGQEGRGTTAHVWRVFEDGKEYLFKHVKIEVPSFSEQDGEDWNICCNGKMEIDRESSTAFIFPCDEINKYAYWKKIFSVEECEKIINFGNSISLENAVVGVDKKIAGIRDSRISWINPSKETEWIFERLNTTLHSLNKQFFKFDIAGFAEGLQFTVYSAPQSKYGAHIDTVFNGQIRKLSLSVQLSDPSSYEGGDLLLHSSDAPYIASKEQGDLTMFPSYTLHEVKPVTVGTRYSLVAWITGPAFK